MTGDASPLGSRSGADGFAVGWLLVIHLEHAVPFADVVLACRDADAARTRSRWLAVAGDAGGPARDPAAIGA